MVCILFYQLSSHKPLSVYPIPLQKEIIEHSGSYTHLQKLFFLYSPTQAVSLKKKKLDLVMSYPWCFMIQPILITSLYTELR